MLGPKFLQFVSDPANGQTAEFHADLRATYGNTINAEFPKLLQIIAQNRPIRKVPGQENPASRGARGRQAARGCCFLPPNG